MWCGHLLRVPEATLVGIAAAACMLVITAYHLGYPESRDPRVMPGADAQGVAFPITRSPLAPVVAHVAMHVAAVLRGIESVSQPPHH